MGLSNWLCSKPPWPYLFLVDSAGSGWADCCCHQKNQLQVATFQSWLIANSLGLLATNSTCIPWTPYPARGQSCRRPQLDCWVSPISYDLILLILGRGKVWRTACATNLYCMAWPPRPCNAQYRMEQSRPTTESLPECNFRLHPAERSPKAVALELLFLGTLPSAPGWQDCIAEEQWLGFARRWAVRIVRNVDCLAHA